MNRPRESENGGKYTFKNMETIEELESIIRDHYELIETLTVTGLIGSLITLTEGWEQINGQ